MKTLRVYGDSFGASFNHTGWSAILSKKLNIAEVNSAVAGSSTEWSVLTLANDIRKNIIGNDDVVILVMSTVGRLHFDFQITERPETASHYLHVGDGHFDANHDWWYFKNKKHIEWWMVNNSLRIGDLNHECYMHLIKEFARIKPNCLFIILKNSDWGGRLPQGPDPSNFLMPALCLNTISINEVDGDFMWEDWGRDPRSNHLTLPNLKILANLLYESINTKEVNWRYNQFEQKIIKKIQSREQYMLCVSNGILIFNQWYWDHLS